MIVRTLRSASRRTPSSISSSAGSKTPVRAPSAIIDLTSSSVTSGLFDLVEPQQAQDEVGGDAQQPDQRRAHGGDDAHGPGDHGGDPLGIDQSDPLRHQFADDQRQVRDGHDHDGDGNAVGIGFDRREPAKLDRQIAGEGGAAIGAGQNADQRDADLDGGQELAWIFHEADGGPGAAVSLVRHLLKSCPPGRNDRQFRHGEKAVQQDQQNDNDQFPGEHQLLGLKFR